jgi:serine/threonine protein phosphatase PrpC
MDIEEVQQYKEYSHLNNHYLKINLTKTSLILIGFHTEPLDNILYLVNLNQEEIKQNSKYKNISLQKLYEKLIDLIEKNKYIITDDKNCMVLSIFEGDNFDITKDFQFFLIKSTEDQNKHYENAVKKIMMSLKKENTEMKNKLKALSTENKNNEKPKEDNPFIDEADKVKTEIAKSKQNSLSKSTREFKRRSTLGLNISTLANLDYNSYPSVELSNGSFNIIAGYGGNTYNGIKRKYNEDKLKIIIDQKLSKEVKTKKGEIINPKICYFAIYDGHSGDKCSKFLQENLHNYIFSSGYFPIYTIQAINEAYTKAEKDFFEKVVDPISDNINDTSGSCALTALILDEWCFIINLGDSRALYSFDSGQSLMQVTRDHKPNDPIEKERIEKAGGSVYKDNNFKINGKIVQIDEKDLPKGVTIPYRMNPGNIAVSK